MKDKAFIEHMIDAAAKIEEYVEDMDYRGFKRNEIVQDAVVRKMEILGEASKRVSDELKDKFPEVPWQDTAGMRDKLIHGYFGVDTKIVWNTIQNDIPAIKSKLQNIKEKEF